MSLAGRSSRLLNNKLEQIEDSDELAQVRRQARGVLVKSFLVAAGLTLLILALPR